MSVPLAVLRLPNPKGDIANFTDAFRELYRAFGLATEFSIDDAVEVLIERRMLSSTGAIGDEALRRSTRDDRSRDPLFNQFKMFSELYRLLGWLHVRDARSRFICTQLGRYVVEYRRDGRNRLVEESMIGIALPNPHSENFGVTNARPFATLLKTIRVLDGLISRDELIVSVYTLSDDLDQTAVGQRLGLIMNARGEGTYDVLSNLLEQAAGVRQVNTLHNYTRFMIGAMRRLGWTESQRRRDIYDRGVVVDVLTGYGQQVAERVATLVDIRSSHLAGSPVDVRAAVCVAGHYGMLERAGIALDASDVTAAEGAVRTAHSVLKPLGVASFRDMLFSPFQQADAEALTAAVGA